MTAELKPRITLEGRTRLETVIPLSTPYLVFLDPSDKCNFRCKFCPSGDKKLLKQVRREPQIMPFGLYKKIIDDLCAMPEHIKTLRLYADGEPLLNPRFCDMVGYAKDTGRFGQIDTTTNGSRLNPWLSMQLVNSGLDKIFISVPTNYSFIYWRNVEELYDFSRRRKDFKIYVKMIADGLDQKEKDKFMEQFGACSDYIFLEHYAPCWPGYESPEVNQEVGIYGQPIKEVQVCPYLFYSVKINSDGTVSICFLDWRHFYIIGDLNRQSFREIWEGPELHAYRYVHLSKLRSDMPSCKDCGQLSHGAPDSIDDYADELLRRL